MGTVCAFVANCATSILCVHYGFPASTCLPRFGQLGGRYSSHCAHNALYKAFRTKSNGTIQERDVTSVITPELTMCLCIQWLQ